MESAGSALFAPAARLSTSSRTTVDTLAYNSAGNACRFLQERKSETGPVILVGHHFNGCLTQLFAAEEPLPNGTPSVLRMVCRPKTGPADMIEKLRNGTEETGRR